MTLTRRGALVLASALPLLSRAHAQQPSAVLVAVAANLQQIFPALRAQFEAQTGARLSPVYGATGNFARQIRQGAPFELLLGADAEIIAGLHADGTVTQPAVTYAEGRLALVAGRGSSFGSGIDRATFVRAIEGGRRFRVAIANPEHAPYGAAAIDVIEQWGLGEALRGRLVYGENVAQAMQYVASGAIEVGLVAASLLAGAGIAGAVVASAVPPQDHRRLAQTLVLTRRAGPAAGAFADYMISEPARRLLREAGFGIPGESA